MLFTSSSQDIYAYRSLCIFLITQSTYELQLKTSLIDKHLFNILLIVAIKTHVHYNIIVNLVRDSSTQKLSCCEVLQHSMHACSCTDTLTKKCIMMSMSPLHVSQLVAMIKLGA